jgi:hypothetical protein
VTPAKLWFCSLAFASDIKTSLNRGKCARPYPTGINLTAEFPTMQQ